MFVYEVEGHTPKLSSFGRGKIIRPKKSLTRFLHAALQLRKSINWPASSIWVFIAQLGEHCSANAEAIGSNPIEAPENFFSGYFCNCLNCDSLQWSHTHFICIPAVHIISFSVSFVSRVDELNKLASLQYGSS